MSTAAEHHPAQWIAGDAENPGIIWYWIKESSTMLQGERAYIARLGEHAY